MSFNGRDVVIFDDEEDEERLVFDMNRAKQSMKLRELAEVAEEPVNFSSQSDLSTKKRTLDDEKRLEEAEWRRMMMETPTQIVEDDDTKPSKSLNEVAVERYILERARARTLAKEHEAEMDRREEERRRDPMKHYYANAGRMSLSDDELPLTLSPGESDVAYGPENVVDLTLIDVEDYEDAGDAETSGFDQDFARVLIAAAVFARKDAEAEIRFDRSGRSVSARALDIYNTLLLHPLRVVNQFRRVTSVPKGKSISDILKGK